MPPVITTGFPFLQQRWRGTVSKAVARGRWAKFFFFRSKLEYLPNLVFLFSPTTGLHAPISSLEEELLSEAPFLPVIHCDGKERAKLD